MLLVLGLLGCSPAPSSTDVQAASSLGWIEAAVVEPAAFGVLMESTGRDGWIALHAHDDARATALFADNPALRTRSAWKVSMLESDLAALSATAHDRLFTRWQERGALPPGGAAIAAWSAWCGDRNPSDWLALVGEDDPGAPLARFLARSPDDWPEAQDEATRRLAAHHEALHGDPKARWDAPDQPVLTVSGDVERTWLDPCFHQVATAHSTRVAAPGGYVAAAEGWGGLSGALFAPWLDAVDHDGEVPVGAWGADAAFDAGLTRVPGLPGDADDAQAAREQSRELADALAARVQALEDRADEDGAALLIELRLGEHWRQQWQLAQARRALHVGRPAQALAFAERGTDFANGAGPLNPPGLYAVRAHALLQLGRSREALDALHELDAHRGVRELAEVVGDLVVLEGLDRAGDSKEN